FRRRRLRFRGVEAFKALRRRPLVLIFIHVGLLVRISGKQDGDSGFLNPVSAGFVALDEISMSIDESSPMKGARPWKMHVNQVGFR
ncbi:unnamed protein product, partial [Brassica rapa subsp. narinosa]